jgi:hypothetical protein
MIRMMTRVMKWILLRLMMTNALLRPVGSVSDILNEFGTCGFLLKPHVLFIVLIVMGN